MKTVSKQSKFTTHTEFYKRREKKKTIETMGRKRTISTAIAEEERESPATSPAVDDIAATKGTNETETEPATENGSASPKAQKGTGRQLIGKTIWGKYLRSPWWPGTVVGWDKEAEAFEVDFFNDPTDFTYHMQDDERVILLYPYDETLKKPETVNSYKYRWRELRKSDRAVTVGIIKEMKAKGIEVPENLDTETDSTPPAKKSAAKSSKATHPSKSTPKKDNKITTTSRVTSSSRKALTTPPISSSSSSSSTPQIKRRRSSQTEISEAPRKELTFEFKDDDEEELPSFLDIMHSPTKTYSRPNNSAMNGSRSRNSSVAVSASQETVVSSPEPRSGVDEEEAEVNSRLDGIVPAGTIVLCKYQKTYYPAKVLNHDQETDKYELEYCDGYSVKAKRANFYTEDDEQFFTCTVSSNLYKTQDFKFSKEELKSLLEPLKDELEGIQLGKVPSQRMIDFKERKTRKSMQEHIKHSRFTEETKESLMEVLHDIIPNVDNDYFFSVLLPEAMTRVVKSSLELEDLEEAEQEIDRYAWARQLLLSRQQTINDRNSRVR